MKDNTHLIDCNITDEIVYDVPEHEIVISFNADCDAEQFTYWWNEVGHKLFSQWCVENEGCL